MAQAIWADEFARSVPDIELEDDDDEEGLVEDEGCLFFFFLEAEEDWSENWSLRSSGVSARLRKSNSTNIVLRLF